MNSTQRKAPLQSKTHKFLRKFMLYRQFKGSKNKITREPHQFFHINTLRVMLKKETFSIS